MKNNPAKNAAMVVFGILAVAAIVYLCIQQRNAQVQKIENWAEQNNYQIVSIGSPMWTRGPLWYRASKNTTVYVIEVTDERGRQRTFYYYFFNSFMYDDQVVEAQE